MLQDREIASLNVVGVDGAESIGVPDDEATAGMFGVRGTTPRGGTLHSTGLKRITYSVAQADAIEHWARNVAAEPCGSCVRAARYVRRSLPALGWARVARSASHAATRSSGSVRVRPVSCSMRRMRDANVCR